MSVKVCYIAGPYRSATINGIYENINRARAKAREYWLKGYAVICPHSNSMFMDGDGTDNIFLDGDLEILRRCDVLVVIGWSAGVKAEYDLANELGLEIIIEAEGAYYDMFGTN